MRDTRRARRGSGHLDSRPLPEAGARERAGETVARGVRAVLGVTASLLPRPKVLLCDEDRGHTEGLARGLDALGFTVEVVRSHAEAFAIACAYDLDALVVAPFLRDGSALVLPSALGIRRPPVVVLMSRMGERLAPAVVRRVGFDAQLTKVVDPGEVERLVRRKADLEQGRRVELARGRTHA